MQNSSKSAYVLIFFAFCFVFVFHKVMLCFLKMPTDVIEALIVWMCFHWNCVIQCCMYYSDFLWELSSHQKELQELLVKDMKIGCWEWKLLKHSLWKRVLLQNGKLKAWPKGRKFWACCGKVERNMNTDLQLSLVIISLDRSLLWFTWNLLVRNRIFSPTCVRSFPGCW